MVTINEKLQKIYLTYYNLLIAQDLWSAHYQILSIIFLKESIELNENLDMMIKSVKLVELNIVLIIINKYCDCFLECINFTGNLNSDSHV